MIYLLILISWCHKMCCPSAEDIVLAASRRYSMIAWIYARHGCKGFYELGRYPRGPGSLGPWRLRIPQASRQD